MVLASELNLCRPVVFVGDTLPLFSVLARVRILPVLFVGEPTIVPGVGFLFSISNLRIAMSTGRLRWSKPSPLFEGIREG